MKLSLNWLNEFTTIEETPTTLADTISASLAEVEDITEIHETLEGVVVGKILEITPHPNADKLQLTRVDVGKETLSIVCGATNISVGDYVPVILVGHALPNSEITIEARDVRGETSHGMLCSPRELGLSNDHSGIFLLNHEKDITVGQRFDSLFETNDLILEIENKALTHRPDAFSHVGIARELSTMFSAKFSHKQDERFVLDEDPALKLMISLQNEQLCRRFSGVIIPNISIAPSSLHMQKRLHRIGVRTTNNIVDITNYVMHELGQPLHAFDRKKLASDTIVVRTANPNEQIVTLDGTTRELTQDMLVIADENKPIALAGIMGGESTEISENTTDLIIESANFEHFNNRKTSRTLGLQSEASTRFAKNQDPSNTLPALQLTIKLLELYAGATVRSTIVDLTHAQTFEGREKRIIPFTTEYIHQKIGGTKQITEKEITKIFEHLGIEVINHANKLGAVPPTFRPDIAIPEDLIEEIARMVGYDNITPTLPTRDLQPAVANQRVLWQRRIKRSLARSGLSEIYSYSFVGKELYEHCGVGDSLQIKLANPIAPEYEYIKPFVLPQLILRIAENAKHHHAINLFELDTVHSKHGVDVPDATLSLGIGIYDQEYPYIKGIIEYVLHELHIPDIRFDTPEVEPVLQLFSTTRVAAVWSGNTLIGHVGELNPSVQATMNIDHTTSIAELNANVLYTLTDTGKAYTPVSQQPEITADLSLVLDETLSLDQVTHAIKQTNTPYLRRVMVQGVHQDAQKFGISKKAVTLRLVFQDLEQSLSKAAIQPALTTIQEELKNMFYLTIN